MTTTKRTLLLLLVALGLSLLLGGTAQARTYDAEEAKFLQLINNHRASNGVGALKASDVLAEAAARHSLDMGRHRFFSHTTGGSDFFPSGSSSWDRMRLTGYPSASTSGENIAGGQYTAQQVFDAWRTSAGHNQNMLNAKFKVIGIARRVVPGSPYGVYWTTTFGSTVDSSAHSGISATPFTDVSTSDGELYAAAKYVKSEGLFEGYPSGALGAWESMTRRHVALVVKRAGLGSRPSWEDDFRPATRGEVRDAFPGLTWNSDRWSERIVRSQVVRLLYRDQ